MKSRYGGAPTEYEKAAYGAVLKVIKDNNEGDYYIQTSQNEEEPRWMSIGSFLEKAFEKSFDDTTFIMNILELFKQNTITA